jgi:hypothetical protein
MTESERQEIIEQAKYDERIRIAKEMAKNPFRWCSVCRDIPCHCRGG